MQYIESWSMVSMQLKENFDNTEENQGATGAT